MDIREAEIIFRKTGETRSRNAVGVEFVEQGSEDKGLTLGYLRFLHRDRVTREDLLVRADNLVKFLNTPVEENDRYYHEDKTSSSAGVVYPEIIIKAKHPRIPDLDSIEFRITSSTETRPLTRAEHYACIYPEGLGSVQKEDLVLKLRAYGTFIEVFSPNE